MLYLGFLSVILPVLISQKNINFICNTTSVCCLPTPLLPIMMIAGKHRHAFENYLFQREIFKIFKPNFGFPWTTTSQISLHCYLLQVKYLNGRSEVLTSLLLGNISRQDAHAMRSRPDRTRFQVHDEDSDATTQGEATHSARNRDDKTDKTEPVTPVKSVVNPGQEAVRYEVKFTAVVPESSLFNSDFYNLFCEVCEDYYYQKYPSSQNKVSIKTEEDNGRKIKNCGESAVPIQW